jgi:hypothetical protein
MDKPSIAIHATLVDFMSGELRVKFASIRPHTDSAFRHIYYEEPHNKIIVANVLDLEAAVFSEGLIKAMLDNYHSGCFVQRYLIFAQEYRKVREVTDPYELTKDAAVKIVFTNSVKAAVAYGCGLLDKGHRYGVYGKS